MVKLLSSYTSLLQGMWIPSYDNELLHLAEDLARRLLPAFDTPTGILLEPFSQLET